MCTASVRGLQEWDPALEKTGRKQEGVEPCPAATSGRSLSLGLKNRSCGLHFPRTPAILRSPAASVVGEHLYTLASHPKTGQGREDYGVQIQEDLQPHLSAQMTVKINQPWVLACEFQP